MLRYCRIAISQTVHVCLASIIAAACTPRTLIVRVPGAPRGGVTYACTQLDRSATDPASSSVQDTCSSEPTTNSNEAMGVAENRPNTRHVYPGSCESIQEFRIYNPDSDTPRITVTCSETTHSPGVDTEDLSSIESNNAVSQGEN